MLEVEKLVRMESAHHLALASILTALLLALPWLANLMLSRSRRSSAATQRRIWISQEILLALSVVLTFVASAVTVFASTQVIAPWVWDMEFRQSDLDSPLTPRTMFFWLSVAALGWAVFRWAGLNSIRDIHRAAKESMDLVLRHRPKNKRPANPPPPPSEPDN